MSDEITALIALDSDLKITVRKPGNPLPAAIKKAPEQLHIPEIKGRFSRLFPSFYEVNHQNEVDPQTRKRVKEKETFTRYLQIPGQEKTAIFTTKELYFVPLYFKFGRLYYEGKYDPNEKRPPDCQSTNGIVPQTNKYARSCEECIFSKWQGSTPPPCGEVPEILFVDMTSFAVKDAEEKAAITREACTVQFKKSAIKAIRELMKQLAEPVLFDDGSYGPVDMTQYLVKVTLEVAIQDGKEANYCVPIFEIVGQVPFEVSEQLIEMLNKQVPQQGNKTVVELFIGRTEPFIEVAPEAPQADKDPSREEKAAKAAPPASKPVTPKASETVVDVSATTTDEVAFSAEAPQKPASKPAAKEPVTVKPDEDDEVVF